MKAGGPRRGATGLCMLGLLVLLLVPASALAMQARGPAARRALRYWTPARMREARPLEARPGDGARGEADEGALAGVDAPVEFEAVADPASPELRRNGVIFLLDDGYPARCSGTSVQAPNRSLVITAGHCVNGGGAFGRWHRQLWVFVPGYRYGQRPFGVFPAERLDATYLWQGSGSENGDVGAAVVGRNERGQLLEDAVGGDPIAWNQPARQHFDVHGYPVGAPFNGETQRLCTDTPFGGHDFASFTFPGPLNLSVSCDITGGASGGAWTIHGSTLNSVTDYDYPDDPTSDFGSYFGDEVARLYGRMSK